MRYADALRLPFGIIAPAALLLGAVSCSGSEFSAEPGAGSGGTLADSGAAGAGHAGAAHHGGASTLGGAPSSADAGAAEGGALGLAGEAEAGAGGTAGAAGAAGAAGELGSGGEAGACTESAWYPDGDGDGFGRSTTHVLACNAPEPGTWSHAGGDCNDDDDAVFPKEPDFQAAGYPVGSGTSFDYDCSGKEEADPSQLGAAPTCASLSVLNCSGSGFAATGRTGDGVNPICGSKTILKCAQSGLSCAAVSSQVQDGVRCR